MRIIKPYRFIPKSEIARTATDILRQMGQTTNYIPRFPLDASRVAEFLGLDVVWDAIEPDRGGAIAARILPLEGLIEINEEIPQLRGGFGESTIAHEIGHWVLHIDRSRVERYKRLQAQGVPIEVQPLMCRNEIQLRGIEWQAQYFASCLLMPEAQLKTMAAGRDLTRWRQLYELAESLGVTISNLTHRLKDLGWIAIEPDSRTIYPGKLPPDRQVSRLSLAMR